MLACSLALAESEAWPPGPVASRIAARLRDLPGSTELASRPLDARALEDAYARRSYRPFWSEDSHLRPEVSELLAALVDAPSHGLDPAAYFTASIREHLRDESPDRLAELDVMLSASLLRYVADLGAGRTDPTALDDVLIPRPPRPDPTKILGEVFDGPGLEAVLETAPPSHPEYRRLRAELKRYRRLEASGGWPGLGDGPTLELGSEGKAVGELCRRLASSGDIARRCDRGSLFDPMFEAAVRRYQRRHGLEPDGRVGRNTHAALNRPPSYWARRIAINLERLRWLPRSLGASFVIVNVPSFGLRLVERGSTTLQMRVMAGTPEHPTPLLHSRITGLRINPPWHVPRSITAQKLLPRILEDPDFLAGNGYEVFVEGRASEPIPAAAIDWEALDPEQMGLQLRQQPGPQNALGRIRFDVSSGNGIYLHDTPVRHLFPNRQRAFTWGCVRLEEPRELATALLADDPGWSRKRIDAEIDSGETLDVGLGAAVPLYVTYLTARVAADAEVEFFDDVYGRDTRLQAALEGTTPQADPVRSGRHWCQDFPASSSP
ncbi:MAG: L,D-transpeptidase family protein [bacterium]|nr:L,D-transpeptidase family protein [bacterium]